MFKIRIFQPIVPEYRVALFNGLGKRYGDRIEIWASPGEGQDKSYPLKSIRYDYDHRLVKVGSLCWQCGFSLRGLKKGDVVVVCGDVHQLSSLWIAAMAKLRSIGVVWWGHHRSATSTERRIKIRLVVAKKLADVFLCYTKTGIRYLEERGFKKGCVFATGNTIDMDAIKQAITEWPSERLLAFQKEKHLEGKEVLAFCSVLRRKTHLELLLKAMASSSLKNRNLELVVIGDGESRMEWMELAQRLGIANRVIWVGALREQNHIAPWFLSAKAYVYPGPIGLSIIHAFSYELPVVCHGNAAHQAPEFEAMADGLTGYVFKEGDVNDLSQQIKRLLDDENKRRIMAQYAQDLVYAKYGMESMINNYCNAIDKAVATLEDD